MVRPTTSFQNTYLNANTSEKCRTRIAAVVPTRRKNDQLSQTGCVFDGPVVLPKLYNGRDKTFFMVSYERYASHTAINYNVARTHAGGAAGRLLGPVQYVQRRGFAHQGSSSTIRNRRWTLTVTGPMYFANNNIASRITPTGAALPDVLSACRTFPVQATPGTQLHLQRRPRTPATIRRSLCAWTRRLRQKDKLNAIYFQAGLTQNYPLQGFPKGIGPGGYGYNVYRNTRGGSLDEVHQFSLEHGAGFALRA